MNPRLPHLADSPTGLPSLRGWVRPSLTAALFLILTACGSGGDSATDSQAVSSSPAPESVAATPAPTTEVTPPTAEVTPPAPPAPPAPPVEPEPTGPGRLETVTPLGTVTTAAIQAALASVQDRIPPLPLLYDVDNYRLVYATTDMQGREVLVSGLLSVPRKAAGARSPLLAYQHGTIFFDAEAPSNHAVAEEPPVILASLGYIVMSADYIGYGASKGVQHPYLRASASASAVIDLLTATRTWRQRTGVADNGQLFLTGYSEGGYVTMATHRALQTTQNPHLAGLVATVPGGGPYDVQATLDGLLRLVRDEYPLLVAVIQPGVLRHLGSTTRRLVRNALLSQLVPDGSDIEFDMAILDHYLADDEAALDRESNLDDWAPAAPVALFHGQEDRTVPYASAVNTLNAMRALGAPQVDLQDCPAVPSSHIGCVPSFVAYMVTRLNAYARDR